ncbi:MAG TPA: glycosyltransferase family 4 protein [Pyrinomonadaceae bacterium]|jgi:glycosyltransferase involved in cell wall biosynthesis
MKIVLLVLGGNPEQASEYLQTSHPGAVIEKISRDQLTGSSPADRLRAVRALGPEIFAVATERLAWQQGQNALLLFGASAGAGRVVLFDSHGASRQETRGQVILRAPFRFLRDALVSWQTLRRARRDLSRLERELASGNIGEFDLRAGVEAAPRITYLRTTPAAGTQSGGASTHTIGFIKGAIESGAQLLLISNDHLAGLDESRVSMSLIEPDPLGLTRAAFDLCNGMLFTDRSRLEIKKQSPDFIYQRYSRFNWSGVEASWHIKRPLFLEYNGSEVWMAKHWGRLRRDDLLERCELLNLAAATRIFVVAEVERNNLIAAGVPREKIVVNPNAVDVEEFRPDAGGESVRRELGINEDETLAGFVGTFGPWHGVLTLAEAISMLPEGCGVRFLFVGDGMYRDEVERIITEAGLRQQVIFVGQVEHHRVPALLDACDLLLSPHAPMTDGSEFFGSPTKLFEYMATGKAIVASRLGQIGEVLVENETALLVEPGSARELADAILRLSGSRDLRERLGAAARHAAIERHTWKQNAQRVIDEYLSLSQ